MRLKLAKEKKTGSSPKTPETSKMEFLVTIVDGLIPSTLVTKGSTFDAGEFLDTPLKVVYFVHGSKCIHKFEVIFG